MTQDTMQRVVGDAEHEHAHPHTAHVHDHDAPTGGRH
jgi:hypothetical protein